MIVLHCTLERTFWICIDKGGLDPMKARTRRKVVWFCTRSKLRWALQHLRACHAWGRARAAVLVCDVPQPWLSRVRRGVYVTARKIPTCRILKVWSQKAPADVPDMGTLD